MVVLFAHGVMSKPIGFNVTETLGMVIPNPRAVVRIPVPKDLTPEQLAWLEAWIDATNAALEAEEKALEPV